MLSIFAALAAPGAHAPGSREAKLAEARFDAWTSTVTAAEEDELVGRGMDGLDGAGAAVVALSPRLRAMSEELGLSSDEEGGGGGGGAD